MTTANIVQQNRDYTLTSWSAQGSWNPIVFDHADGVYVWDSDGKRYLDWSAQLVNVNIGHSHPHVVEAIQQQAARLTYVQPTHATAVRGRLGELIAEVTPGDLNKTFFTLGGADAIENAMKIARLYTGKDKILTRYKSYHGGSFATASAGGDPRRQGIEPGVPWIVRLPDPYAYRSPIYKGRTQEEGDLIVAELIEEIVLQEGPKQCAAIMLEGYSGSSGVMQPSALFWSRIQQICDKYELLLIVDEVMSGWGRTGEWFGVDHYPDVKPDILATAKGLTSGYVPLGACVVSEKIGAYFDDHVLQAGLTYSAHSLACAAAIATIEVYRAENLIERAREMGKVLRRGLMDLAEKHPVIGDVRGAGLHHVIELVKDRETREPLSPFNAPLTPAMGAIGKVFKQEGLTTIVRWNYVFNTPPLTITEEQIQEGLAILDQALDAADQFYEGAG
ncbi:MAG: aminotransferase class III-fold pyridoxal phosphate-dependent enzyme [Chloroflexota bacterium]|nr:aminotransferase class III-fold pyridoxal phosphate-dependent enzyme [Chloroflexota bacterium]